MSKKKMMKHLMERYRNLKRKIDYLVLADHVVVLLLFSQKRSKKRRWIKWKRGLGRSKGRLIRNK